MASIRSIFFSKSWFTNNNYKVLSIIAILAMLPLIFGLVYVTGGIKYVYSHTMYIPILLAGIFINPGFGIITALIAGILLGPIMPYDVLVGDQQAFVNWFYRLLIFLLLGSISGFASQSLRKTNLKIKHLLTHHVETNLPNINALTYFKDQLSHQRYMISTIMIHNTDQIIDVLGIDIYNLLLTRVYEHMQTTFKGAVIVQSDHHKFWFIKPIKDLESDSKFLAQSIQSIKKINEIPVFIDFTIGTHHILTPTNIMHEMTYRYSDLSAKLAKNLDKDYVIYKEQKIETHHAFEIIASFEDALKTGQLELYYQPKIDLNTLKPIGLEALIRWRHPVKGMIPPNDFIPIIEKTKLIHLLTFWVLESSIKQVNKFNSIGFDVPISVNISTSNINQIDFFENTMALLKKYQVPAKCLELEITEHVLMKNPDLSRDIISKFMEQGITVSLDDFGTGYSSLAYLDTFNIHVVKLDRYFIDKIDQQSANNQVVISTIELAKQLNYKIVAEGIETQEQLDFVKSHGCHYAQGYLFAKPMPTKDIERWYLEALK